MWIIVLVAVVVLLSVESHAAGRTGSYVAFAESIAQAEGFGVAGAIPTVRNNPGDLVGSDGQIRSFSTVNDGWAALYRQLDLMRDGLSRNYDPDDTIAEVAAVWTQTQQTEWARNVVAGMNARGFSITAHNTLAEVLS